MTLKMKIHPQSTVVALLALILLPSGAFAQDVLPRPEQPFKGHIGRTARDSTPDFLTEVHAPNGAPNILLSQPDLADTGNMRGSVSDEGNRS